MASSLQLGQFLRGRNGIYTLVEQLQETVWLAKHETPITIRQDSASIRFSSGDGRSQPVTVKSDRHFRLQNERDVLKRFQSRTLFIRSLIDEIVELSDPPAIILKYLDDHLLINSNSRKLTNREIKYVTRRILEALRVLYKDNFVNTDIKPDNILVNYGQGDVRFTDIQLADSGSTVPTDAIYTKDGDLIGAPIWRSPEAYIRIGWDTSADIWSFGASLITLLYGDNFFLFKPDVPTDHDEYVLKILQRQCQSFGCFPLKYREIYPQEILDVLAYMMQSIPPEEKRPLARIPERKISK